MEQELVRRITGGDRGAFEELYELYGAYALRTAKVITGDRDLAADAVQETFIRIFHHISSFDPAREFKPWFYKVLLNECCRLMRNKNKVVSLDSLEKELPAKADEHVFEEYADLYQALKGLEEINRLPVILKYLNGFSEKEIAEITGTNQNTVKSRLFKGRQKLKEMLVKVMERGAGNG